VLPVTASVVALAAAGMYLVWKCRFRGKVSESDCKIFFLLSENTNKLFSVKRRNKENQTATMLRYVSGSEFGDENIELPFFSFGEVVTATKCFSDNNFLGQGGFGKVYKVTKKTF
jgi:hypothetical protein